MESKSKLINSTRQKDSLTYNKAITHSTSLNSVLDLFFIAGASRNMSVSSIENMLEKSMAEDALLTLKTIFWAGDIRGGAGERRFFRISLEWLNRHYSEFLEKNLHLVSEYNRWDSLFLIDNDKVYDLVYKSLFEEKNGLCAKWMPRKSQCNGFGHKFRNKFGLGAKEYRNLIVELSKTVEQQMCSKQWDKIEYQKVPSVAMNKYRKAFFRNDESRFTTYLNSVQKGEQKINAGAIFPYDIYKAYLRGDNEKAIDTQWNSLPNYMESTEERILPVCDVSGSMGVGKGLPLAISVSLGIYLSERNIGIFKDAFITFSESPSIEYLKGSLTERMCQLKFSEWGMNTNLDAVFRLILDRAVENNLPENEMPTMILIISDMEFDECGSLTNYETIVKNYKEAGYEIPKIVFWNVNGRQGNVPVNNKTKNVALVSGSSPSIMKSILSGKDFSPVDIMLGTLNSDRYSKVSL